MANPIGWCVKTCNPVVGCYGPGGTEAKPNRCPWCYATRIAPRVAAMQAASSGKPVCQDCRDFRPHFHPERLDQIGRGMGNLFVGSMCDLWGDGVSCVWRDQIWDAVRSTNRSVTVLTKTPERITTDEITDLGGWPQNLWIGASMTGHPAEALRLESIQARVPRDRYIISAEPLLGECLCGMLRYAGAPAWLIVGPQTGPGAKPPRREWVDDLIRYADETDTPLWLKNGCYNLWPDLPVRQEWPKGMERGAAELRNNPLVDVAGTNFRNHAQVLEQAGDEIEALRADKARLDALDKASTMAAVNDPVCVYYSDSNGVTPWITGCVSLHDCPWMDGPDCCDDDDQHYCHACDHAHDLDLSCDGDDIRTCLDALVAKVAKLEAARE